MLSRIEFGVNQSVLARIWILPSHGQKTTWNNLYLNSIPEELLSSGFDNSMLIRMEYRKLPDIGVIIVTTTPIDGSM